jgi:hypothetical protein
MRKVWTLERLFKKWERSQKKWKPLRVEMHVAQIEREIKRVERIYHRKLTGNEQHGILKILEKAPLLTFYEAWKLWRIKRVTE